MPYPRVSILFPVYNTAAYLREAMDSLLSQTFTDFELIVLDDCTPDDSPAILDTYTDPRIVRYRGAQNVGLANVLNVGLDMARGEYIARMDSDDISLPERLQIQVDYLDTHPDIDLCSCGMQLFGDQSATWIRDFDPEDVKITALFFSPILHASSMWRKSSFDQHSIIKHNTSNIIHQTSFPLRFRQNFVPAEDYDLWTRALLAGLRMVNLPQVLYRYRIFGGQATSTSYNRRMELERMIKQNYLLSLFPNMDMDKAWCLYDAKSEIKRKGMDYILSLNLQTPYFNHSQLTYRFDKLYRATILHELQSGPLQWRLFFQLSWKQQIKLLFSRLKKK